MSMSIRRSYDIQEQVGGAVSCSLKEFKEYVQISQGHKLDIHGSMP